MSSCLSSLSVSCAAFVRRTFLPTIVAQVLELAAAALKKMWPWSVYHVIIRVVRAACVVPGGSERVPSPTMDSRPEVLRSTQTPLKRGTDQKTPLRTPLRTPLSAVSEQTSSTPITPFEAIESQKENVQPRSRGRSAHALSHTLSMHHKERQEVLAMQRQEWEERVLGPENQDSDDPLEAWCAYVKWCIDNYPDGKSSDSGIVPLLERATREFRSSEQYQNDSRYLRLWILYAQHTDVPRDVFHFLMANEIGTKLASLYEELAHVLESYEMYDEADEMYRLGMARRASPLDRLKRRYHEYQKRILEMPTSTNDGAPMTLSLIHI